MRMFFFSKGPLITGRYRHTATRLIDGRVLIVGGMRGPMDYLASAEIWDPQSGLFSPAGQLNYARADHTATLLPTGLVLIAGGQDQLGSGVAPAEIFDPNRRRFKPGAVMNSGRYQHTATLLGDGSVVFIGGMLPNSHTAELYKPTSSGGVFKAIGSSMSIGRWDHGTTFLEKYNQILVTGGRDSVAAHGTAELYNVAAGTFRVVGKMSSPRFGHVATLFAADKVLVTGGINAVVGPWEVLSSAEVYNHRRETFERQSDMRRPRSHHEATMLPEGDILLTGGQPVGMIGSAEIYSRASMGFVPTPGMRVTRAGHKAVQVLDGSVLIAGGWTTGGSLDINPEINSRIVLPKRHRTMYEELISAIAEFERLGYSIDVNLQPREMARQTGSK